MAEFKSREIGCCGVDSWTKVIAWLQIVSSVMSALSFLFLFGASDKQRQEEGSGLMMTALVLSFVVFLVSFVMGLVLLKGAKERNSKYLVHWLLAAKICIVTYIVLKLGILIVGYKTTSVILDLLQIIIILVTSIFSIWVVDIFNKEVLLDLDTGPSVEPSSGI